MGLLDKFKKGGGGFWNNVDALITDYKFTADPDFGGEAKERKEGASTPLWVQIFGKLDGSEEVESTHLFAGSADDFVISEDGRTIQPVDGASLWGGTAFYQFYNSLIENAGDSGLEDVDVADGDPLNFEHIIGVRTRFVQVKDDEAMKRAAKKSGQSRGKINAQGQKKGKDGKFYDIRTLQVSTVYSVGNDVTASSKPAGKAAAGKPSAKPAAAKGKAPVANTEAADFAEQTLLDILVKAKDKTLVKSKLNLAVTKELVGDARSNDVRKWIYDDVNLNGLVDKGVITYDAKTQTIALA